MIPVHYAVGHLMVPGGDSAQPYGDYLISMNKLAKDTFMAHGPLVAEAHEVFDITGDTSPMVDQVPLPPETHYSQAIPVSMVNPIGVYELPAEPESPRVEYDYGTQTVNVFMTAIRSWFDPGAFNVPEGWTVRMKITNVEQSLDITHGLAVTGHNVSVSLDPGQVRTIEFTAGDPGVHWYYCIWFCSELHWRCAAAWSSSTNLSGTRRSSGSPRHSWGAIGKVRHNSDEEEAADTPAGSGCPLPRLAVDAVLVPEHECPRPTPRATSA